MTNDAVQLCTQVIQSFDRNTQIVIGALLTVLINLIMLVRVYLNTRQLSEKVDQVKAAQ